MVFLLMALFFSVGVFLFFRSLAISSAGMGHLFWHRMQAYKKIDAVVEEEEELKPSFGERVFKPFLARTQKFLLRRTPEGRLSAIQAKLEMAGKPAGLTPAGFLFLRYIVAFVLLAAFGCLASLLSLGIWLSLGAAGLGSVLGFFFPALWLRQKIGDRRNQIARALPDAMDLITTVVEAGMGFDGAIGEVAVRFKNVLGAEFSQVLRETKLGRSRVEALEDMARRCGDEDIHNFVLAIVQSEQMGTSVAKVLRIQSGELRRVRRQRAQQKAGAAPVKMLLPMVGCIFPVIWIVLMGPAALTVMKSFGH